MAWGCDAVRRTESTIHLEMPFPGWFVCAYTVLVNGKRKGGKIYPPTVSS